ncbi:potassium transporter [Sulfurimonas lithotrophica]|uniref:Potassium transporter n=1 Tax=Sulfurimonas lithotrophica TaxID=2590022 RepID=A0A5P8P3Q4_9BACT|nr:cation:proton antiporter [Sulfurimonas lithotrophica]QFR50362.1 potassium transporter [Sulfurimonas lithotrophica]
METLLLAIFATIFLATLMNILFKRYNVSHIVGYIFTGIIISYLFDFNTLKIDALNLVAEFGIVFLMFTIGLELSFKKIKKMKESIFIAGAFQMGFNSVLFFIFCFYIFGLDAQTSIIISLAFSLSSTAIIMPYLQNSKDIVTPYGKKVVGILIFQDLAVIPILLLISFLSHGSDISITEVIVKTLVALIFITLFVFYIGDKIVESILKFAANTQLEEIFLGAIFTIVIGMSILTHEIGFTYSMGAFLAGVLIADTKYNIKVESDILSYKNLLLSIFFFSVGTKIDMIYLFSNLHKVFVLFILVMIVKTIVIYFIAKRKSDKNTSVKTALALSQVSGFGFVVLDMASSKHLIQTDLANLLLIIIFLTMIVSTFILSNIYKISSYFEKEFYEADVITPIDKKNHIIIAGFGTLGKAVAKELSEKGIDFIIISDNLQHVLKARKSGFMAYFGHLNKRPVMESLKVEESSSIIVTAHSEHQKILIIDALKEYSSDVNIVVKVDSDEENSYLNKIKSVEIVDSNYELSSKLVELSLKH